MKGLFDPCTQEKLCGDLNLSQNRPENVDRLARPAGAYARRRIWGVSCSNVECLDQEALIE